jgi:hypothetical protein
VAELKSNGPIRLATKMHKKMFWAPARNFRAPIGATQGTALAFDFLCLFVAKLSAVAVLRGSDPTVE